MTTFKNFLATFDADPHKRGKQFERFVKWFLINDPLWSSDVEKIWLWKEYPDRWGTDCGIDLVFKHKNGETWAVQAKCYAPTNSITKADMDTFLSESSRHGIDQRLLVATTELISSNAKQVCDAPQAKKVTRIMLSHLESAMIEYPARLEDLDKVKKKEPPKPRAHQIEAIAAVAKQFKTTDRGQLIMACGTGKTYTTLWVKEKLAAQNTLVLLPSLGLLSQTLREWTATRNKPFEVLCVCSDQSVGKKEEDESITSVTDIGFPVTSDVKEIQEFIKGPGARVIFSTYQSSPLIAEAQKNKKLPAFDLVIADEAHRCAGKVGTDFSTVLDNKLIRADKRLFATATPRVYSAAVKTAAEGRGVEMVGMDDEALFGKVLYSLPFGKAIARNLLTDYQVVIIGVDNPMILKWIKDRELLELDPVTPLDAQALASLIGLLKALNNYDLKRVISFHSRVNRAESFVNDIQKVNDWIPPKHRPSGQLITDFVSGTMPTDKRRQKLDRLKSLGNNERGILSNARCLSEGVDVPSLDGVAFIDPRASQVDIIQAVGRAIRLSTNKKIGTIVLPVFIEDGENAQASIEASNFKPIWDVLNALRAHDDVLSQELDQARTALGKDTLTKNKQGGLSKIVVDLPASVDASFSNSLKTHLVEQVTESWNFWYGLLLKYVGDFGDANIPTRLKFNSFNLGSWVSDQRKIKNKLNKERTSLLETLPNWSWDVLGDNWYEGFEYLKKYASEYGDTKVPYILKYEKYSLGRWVSSQRINRDKLDIEKIKLLELLPQWTWSILGEQWNKGLEYLKKYIKENGHARVPNRFKYDDFKLGAWVNTQRINKIKLTSERVELLESLPQWSWRALEDKWEEGFEYLKKYVEEHGSSRVSRLFKYDDFNLGHWVSNNRCHKNKLSQIRIQLLETLPLWTWDAVDAKWNEGFEYLKQYVEENGHARASQSLKYKGFNLGTWLVTQRSRKAKLNREKIKLLESLPKWSWDALEDKWSEGFEFLKKYIAEHGHAKVPTFFTYGNFNLGSWVSRQRSRKNKLTKEKIKLLESLPQWVWEILEDKWNLGFGYLKKYINKNSIADIHAQFKYEGFNLGLWVSSQRKMKKILSPEKIKLLESLPQWYWGFKEDKWAEGFENLKKYVGEQGHSRVPARMKFNDFNLGAWVGTQRYKRDKLSLERIKLLESLENWSWNAIEDQWSNGFEYLKKYVYKYNHSRIPIRLKFEGFNLGKWVSHQRADKNKLSPEKIKSLELLPHWSWSILKDRWNEGLHYLKKYAEEHGHSRVPAKLIYKNFNLGAWVNTQKVNKNKISQERIRLLELLPKWSWGVKPK